MIQRSGRERRNDDFFSPVREVGTCSEIYPIDLGMSLLKPSPGIANLDNIVPSYFVFLPLK